MVLFDSVCGWFGIQTWIGGLCVYQLLVAVWHGFAEVRPPPALTHTHSLLLGTWVRMDWDLFSSISFFPSLLVYKYDCNVLWNGLASPSFILPKTI